MLEVAAEQVARADEHALIFPFAEGVDARVLKPAAYDACDRDVLRHALDAGAQAADAADKELDLYASLGALDELFHHVFVIQGVDLDGDAALVTLGLLALEKFQHPGFEAVGRDPEVLRLGRQFAVQQGGEGGLAVQARLLVCGNKGEVGVLLAGDLVVVTGAHLGDAREIAVVLTGDDAELGVHLVLGQAVDHMAARVLQHLGIVDVVLLVESGPQLK